MADEGYKLQVSVKVGKTMINVRADDVDEFDLLLKNLRESENNPVSNAIADLVESELVEEEKPAKKSKPKKKSSKKMKNEPEDDDEDDDADDDDEDDDEDEDAPSPLQLELGKKLKVKGYKDMTATELKKAIKKKKAKKS